MKWKKLLLSRNDGVSSTVIFVLIGQHSGSSHWCHFSVLGSCPWIGSEDVVMDTSPPVCHQGPKFCSLLGKVAKNRKMEKKKFLGGTTSGGPPSDLAAQCRHSIYGRVTSVWSARPKALCIIKCSFWNQWRRLRFISRLWSWSQSVGD